MKYLLPLVVSIGDSGAIRPNMNKVDADTIYKYAPFRGPWFGVHHDATLWHTILEVEVGQ